MTGGYFGSTGGSGNGKIGGVGNRMQFFGADNFCGIEKVCC